MTNAEKFKEDFGFWIDEDVCITNVNGCGKCPLDKYRDTDKRQDCTQGFWSSDYQGEPTISLSVIEKIHDAIDNADADGFLDDEHGYYIGSMLTKEHVDEIIDKAVKECTHEV